MPFFVSVETMEDYRAVLNAFPSRKDVCVSAFCAGEDLPPDWDRLKDWLKENDAPEEHFLLGAGESVRFSPDINPFLRLKDLWLSHKLVVICRFSRHFLEKMCTLDPKFNGKRVCFLQPTSEEAPISVTQFLIGASENAENGFQKLLEALESGRTGNLCVLSSLPFLKVQDRVRSVFEYLRWQDPSFNARQEWLSEKQWEEFQKDPDLELAETGSWRQFLALKLRKKKNEASYLEFAAEKCASAQDFPKQLQTALLQLPHHDERFPQMYQERKKLLRGREEGIRTYLESTKFRKENRIFYLTDQTQLERQAIIGSLEKKETFPAELRDIYPALHAWLAEYDFSGVLQEELRQLLVSYFKEYKRLKLTNQLTPEFLHQVEELAHRRPFNQLPTRGAVLGRFLSAPHRTFLIWVDALGVEYLSFLQSRANDLKFRMKTHIVRAELPTLTKFNDDFFNAQEYAWPEEHREKEGRLDKLKHMRNADAGYIEEELRILDDVLKRVCDRLECGKYDRVLIVSDHGASRLAVLNEHENRWEMSEKGKHSGRCCPQNEMDEKPDLASDGNGFWSLANYDMFRGGRKDTCEVHGGASLEEVVIPLIELTLDSEQEVEIQLESPKIKAGARTVAKVRFFCLTQLEMPYLKVNGSFYPVQSDGEKWFESVLHDLKKPGTYRAELYDNDSLLTCFDFEIEQEGMKKIDFFGLKRKNT